MKYIAYQTGDVVVFGDVLSHKEVAGERKVRSAGFCRFETYRNNYDDVRCKAQVWGKSHTSGVNSDERDAFEIEKLFFTMT